MRKAVSLRKHKVKHEAHNSDGGSAIRNIILGGQDGLVNVFGLILGVAAATGDSRIIIISGLAGTAAESISMAAVAYTSTKAARDYYYKEVEREKYEVDNMPQIEKKEIRDIYHKKGFRGKELAMVVNRITSNKKIWVNTMMSDELRLFPDEYEHPGKDAIVVGISSVVGSLVPLMPFFFLPVYPGMVVAFVVCTITLFVTGALKAKYTVGDWKKSGVEMATIGMISALAGFLIGKWLGVNV